ncbi:PfkB family carbohydrate kinase [Mesorhizobium sp. M0166]|uniref:PfkB family carbohydrate kinase n=1 Tax=unclassified Mesorhizobium TaxID=325217 RepID=UPI00333DCEC5
MTAPRLLCVGALTYDTILRLDVLPSGAGKFLPSEAVQIAAGMAASAAASASRQGGQVWLWASVGDDAVGRDVIGQMETERVDCSLVRRVEGGRSAIATILVDAAGERMIVPFYDAATQADPDRLPPADFSRFDAVLVDVRWPGAAALALAKAREYGIPAILDADVASRPVLDRLLPLASHVVASLPAARILCGPEISAGSAVAILGERTGAFMAVTDGANGTAFRYSDSNDVRHLPSPRVEAVDTLAAGDVFHGTFALGLAEGWDEERAIAVASAAAALKCLRFGGRLGAPTRAETLAFMQGST